MSETMRRKGALFALLLTVFIDMVGFGIIIPFMPFWAEHFDATPDVVTMLFATYSGVAFFFSFFWGWVSDRWGRKPVLLLSLMGSVVSFLWLGFADALWVLFAARALFPDAELIGSDLSETQLRHGYRVSQRAGAGIEFKQRLAHDTREPNSSIDAAISFAFFHELPRDETLRVLKEMYRILRPGGSLIIVDPPPFKKVDLFQSVIMDWESLHHGEPFFSVSCASHWAAEMEKIGFENVREKAFHERNNYPYVTVGTKPGALDE